MSWRCDIVRTSSANDHVRQRTVSDEVTSVVFAKETVFTGTTVRYYYITEGPYVGYFVRATFTLNPRGNLGWFAEHYPSGYSFEFSAVLVAVDVNAPGDKCLPEQHHTSQFWNLDLTLSACVLKCDPALPVASGENGPRSTTPVALPSGPTLGVLPCADHTESRMFYESHVAMEKVHRDAYDAMVQEMVGEPSSRGDVTPVGPVADGPRDSASPGVKILEDALDRFTRIRNAPTAVKSCTKLLSPDPRLGKLVLSWLFASTAPSGGFASFESPHLDSELQGFRYVTAPNDAGDARFIRLGTARDSRDHFCVDLSEVSHQSVFFVCFRLLLRSEEKARALSQLPQLRDAASFPDWDRLRFFCNVFGDKPAAHLCDDFSSLVL